MLETFEGRYWFNNKKPNLCIISSKMPNVNADDINISHIDNTLSTDEIIAKLKTEPMDVVYTDLTDLDLFHALIHMGVVVYMPEHIEGIKSWSTKKWGTKLHTVGGYKKNKASQNIRRMVDIAGGLAGCLPLAVAYPFVAIAIKKEDGGPVIYKQRRVGYNGREFDMYKFRSMKINADDELDDLKSDNEMQGDYMFKVENDPRITKVGKFIRKTSIDELPQFINVLKGDMSIIGTRPPTKDETLNYKARHKVRLIAKPGITGAWQTHGRNNITNFDEIVNMDKNYNMASGIKESSNIFMRTIYSVLDKDGK